jgi:hypothetical protein
MKVYKNQSGEFHRTNGPAFEYDNGDKFWYVNDNIHREDGHAVEFNNGSKFWYLNGIEYSEDQYQQELIKLKLKRLKNL